MRLPGLGAANGGTVRGCFAPSASTVASRNCRWVTGVGGEQRPAGERRPADAGEVGDRRGGVGHGGQRQPVGTGADDPGAAGAQPSDDGVEVGLAGAVDDVAEVDDRRVDAALAVGSLDALPDRDADAADPRSRVRSGPGRWVCGLVAAYLHCAPPNGR
jgi:hypothetical protein